MRRPTAILYVGVLLGLLWIPAIAFAHGSTEAFRARVLEVTPEDAPITARVVGDQLVVENHGDGTVTICDDDDGPCVGREVRAGDTARIVDERLHWLADSLPPGVDSGDPDPQRVSEVEIPYRSASVDGTIRARLDYVGGRTWLRRYGEYGVLGPVVLIMLAAFAVDASRRRTVAEASDAATHVDDATHVEAATHVEPPPHDDGAPHGDGAPHDDGVDDSGH